MQNDISFIINEIRSYLGFKTDTQLADYLGVKRNTISTWRKRNSIDYQLIVTKCDFVDANWLLTGKGDMLKSETQPIISLEKELIVESIGDKQRIIDYQDQEIARLKRKIEELESEQKSLSTNKEKVAKTTRHLP